MLGHERVVQYSRGRDFALEPVCVAIFRCLGTYEYLVMYVSLSFHHNKIGIANQQANKPTNRLHLSMFEETNAALIAGAASPALPISTNITLW